MSENLTAWEFKIRPSVDPEGNPIWMLCMEYAYGEVNILARNPDRAVLVRAIEHLRSES